MKKLFALALALLLIIAIPCEAFAELPDFAAMSDDELQELVNAARNELASRKLKAEENTVLYEDNNIQIYLTANQYVENYGDTAVLYLEAVVINDNEKDIGIMVDSASVNGWEIYGDGIYGISAGKKKKEDFELSISDADVFSMEEVEDLEIKMYIFDGESYETLFRLDPITLFFNE